MLLSTEDRSWYLACIKMLLSTKDRSRYLVCTEMLLITKIDHGFWIVLRCCYIPKFSSYRFLVCIEMLPLNNKDLDSCFGQK